ncbi:PadR family transcriptional regulator [Cytobacillus dafuensis]|uniref:PadR family transcriptional regulator n=1 Tax=Cytobacillus dafuensis TaxID=1742359 RepID=A0A5B8Z3V1_CYTDA|nr:PadR family transcriptional regulator [Cytobacillus dafuensis]QED46289.1 PadR family transcriptional regulator [Cytobacillus dafuensis]
MSLRYGILGMLSKWEASGYDIKKEFDEYMSIFWHSHLSQIYPELNKLEKDELISSKLVKQVGKPDKKVYSITDKGRKELMNWLLTPPETLKMKDTFLMQTFFMDNIPAEEVLLKLRMYKKERQQRLEQIKIIMQDRLNSIKERNVMKSRILMSSAVLKRGIEQEMYYLKWCDETIELVEKCKFLWAKEEAARIEHINSQSENKEIQSTASATYTEVEEIFLKYFAGLVEEEK